MITSGGDGASFLSLLPQEAEHVTDLDVFYERIDVELACKINSIE